MNAGAEGAVVVGELLKSDNPQWGHNAATGEYGDMIAAGIIDPTKVCVYLIDSTGFDASWRLPPSSRYRRDARVYDHTTTAMHEIDSPEPVHAPAL